MVTVSGYKKRQAKDGQDFIVLELTGGLEMVQSQTSGKFRAVVRKCTLPASFDETVAKAVVGTQMPGQIVRVESEPYSITDERTGEVITLNHSWSFVPEGATVVQQQESVFA